MRNLSVLTLLGALFFVAECSSAQAGLATPYDGQDVYFSSLSRLPGSADLPDRTTIYHYNAGAWAAVAHSLINSLVTAPFLTGDAGIVGWQKTQVYCYGSYIGYYCNGSPTSTSQLSGIDMQSVKINPYALTISSNGRFLATPGYNDDYSHGPTAVQDLTTGQMWNPQGLSAMSFYGGWQVANDGTLIGLKAASNGFPVQPPVLVRWRPGAENKDILTAPAIPGFSLSADGRHAAVETRQSTGAIQTRLVDLESGSAETILQQDSSQVCCSRTVSTSMSADGSRVLFFSPYTGQTPPVYFWDHGTGVATALSGLPEGAAGAVISGNGAIAWVATKSTRLLRFDLNQGAMTEILSLFPTALRFLSSSGVPGSLVRYQGSAAINGEHFRSNGLEFPIVPINDADQTAIQVPWELAAQIPTQGFASFPLVLQKDGYPFELALTFSATGRIAPVLDQGPPVPGNYPAVKAASTDFSHLIDAAHPAIPGETIVVWMTGLGPLDQPVATGAPGPFNPIAHPMAHLDCGLVGVGGQPAWQGLIVPFVGYAPGLVGLYQVNVTLPGDWPAGTALVDCYSGTQSSTRSIAIGPAR